MIAKVATGEIEDVRPTPESEVATWLWLPWAAWVERRGQLECRAGNVVKRRENPVDNSVNYFT